MGVYPSGEAQPFIVIDFTMADESEAAFFNNETRCSKCTLLSQKEVSTEEYPS